MQTTQAAAKDGQNDRPTDRRDATRHDRGGDEAITARSGIEEETAAAGGATAGGEEGLHTPHAQGKEGEPGGSRTKPGRKNPRKAPEQSTAEHHATADGHTHGASPRKTGTAPQPTATHTERAREKRAKTSQPQATTTPRGLATHGTQDDFRIAGLQQDTKLLPRITDHLRALRTVASCAPSTHKGQGGVRRTTTSLERKRDELPTRRGIAGVLVVHRVGRCETIFVGPGPLTRRVAAVSAGHRSVHKDRPPMDSVPGGDVKACLLKHTGTGVYTVPSGHPLLGCSRVPSDEPMKPSSEVAKGVVTNAPERPHLTFERVFAAAIKRCATQCTMLVPMLTNSTLGTDRQEQPVPERDGEVLVRENSGSVAIQRERGLQEAASSLAAMGSDVNPVILGEALEEDSARARP